jgi:formate dehydrogenase major subunit
VPGLGTSFGRGGATNFQQDLSNADCIVIQGSNMAECHPVGFQWVMEAKARGATIIHVDPRFTRTSAVADLYVPLRAGTDIAFLGGIVNYVLQNELDFKSYVAAYTNASFLISEEYRDTEDLDGLFSGFDPDSASYDTRSWQYAGGEGTSEGRSQGEHPGGAESGQAYGSGGPAVEQTEPERDPTLTHPRCVYQLLKRHFSRYTPEMVEEICGTPKDTFLRVCEEWTRNSGRDRTTAVCYAVGWTQHSVGVQIIRAASILQLLLGNIGRPGGGIMALRGHASIQGSTDIPTLYNLLPGYLQMPHAHTHDDLDSYLKDVAGDKGVKGFWGHADAYTVSLLKSWFGAAATPENDFCFPDLPRIDGDHGTYAQALMMVDGQMKGFFLAGENPAVGSAHGRVQRLGLANLDWLVVRDFSLIESATFWKDGPEVATGEMSPETCRTEVFFFPAAAHTEKDGSFTNTQRMLQWHHKAVEPPGDCRSDLHFYFHLGRMVKQRLADSDDPRDRLVRDLTWDYPTSGPTAEPSAEAVLAEVNGYDADGRPISAYAQLKADGSTSCGCWIYCGTYADGVNQAARRKPGSEQSLVAPEWGWAWPANRRILYNRASADPAGRPWSERKACVWWDEATGRWTGEDVPDFEPTKRPDYRPPEDAKAEQGLAGDDPFIMMADGKAWLYVPHGLVDGPLPTHYEPNESPFENRLYRQQANPTRVTYRRKDNPTNPSRPAPGSEIFPYVFTTTRLTEHHTAGGMSRFLPYLSELQPELFVEVSPELAAERGLTHMQWAHVVTSRTALEARVLVTHRIRPLRVQGRTVHQVGIPYHWGSSGLTRGDAANDLLGVALDPNVSIQESKVSSCDIRPGRRPSGPALLDYVAGYRRRAGVTEDTGRAP